MSFSVAPTHLAYGNNMCRVPLSCLQRAALQLEKYPPRRTLQLLDKQHTDGERPALERIIVEDYVLDVLMAFEGDRIECARRLVQGDLVRECCRCGPNRARIYSTCLCSLQDSPSPSLTSLFCVKYCSAKCWACPIRSSGR